MKNILSQTKVCSKCKKEKSIDDFYKRRSECKDCKNKSFSKYWESNKSKIKEQQKGYYEAHKENRLKQVKDWYKNNKEYRSERHKAYKKNHVEKYREYARKGTKKWLSTHPEYRNLWRELNPHKGRQYDQKRRAALLKVGGIITAEEWEKLLDFYGHKCLCCKRTDDIVKLHIDHVVPVSKGGANIIENAQPLCRSCNCSKFDKIIDYRINFK